MEKNIWKMKQMLNIIFHAIFYITYSRFRIWDHEAEFECGSLDLSVKNKLYDSKFVLYDWSVLT